MTTEQMAVKLSIKTAAYVKVLEENTRLREALVKIRAHTGYLEPADIGLLRGLLSSVERITEAALAESKDTTS